MDYMGLVLTRKDKQSITIQTPTGDELVIQLVLDDGCIRLNIDAPRVYQIHRTEILGRTDLNENKNNDNLEVEGK